jgi:hypothetical protein
MRNRDELIVSVHSVSQQTALTVTSANSVWMIFWIRASVSGSTEDVASSNNKTLHFLAKALMSDTRQSASIKPAKNWTYTIVVPQH